MYNFEASGSTDLRRFYLNAGYFPNQIFNFWPKPLEIAMRYAEKRLDLTITKNKQKELALAFNWFFVDHLNILKTEITKFTFEDQALPQIDELRFRLQNDVSF